MACMSGVETGDIMADHQWKGLHSYTDRGHNSISIDPGPHVPGYPGGHEHQELPGQGPQLSQQQGRVQTGSHSENQKTSYSWAVNKWRKSHLFIFSLSFFTIHKFPFRIQQPSWSRSSEHHSLTDEIQRMKHVSKSVIVKMLIVHHKG